MVITPGQITRRANFYFQLASLLSAGVAIMQALELARKESSPGYEWPVSTILQRLQQGSTLGEAIAATGDWLPPFDHALIAAGEASGRLDITFRALGTYYEQRAAMLRQILSGVAYPIFILHLAILIFPTRYLTGLFLANGVQDLILQKAAVLLPCYLLIGLAVFALQGSRGPHWRGLMERILNGIPLLGSARRDLALSRLASSLEALLSAGVPIIQAWGIAAEASGSQRLRNTIRRAIPKMETGVTPSETLRQSSAFPELFSSLYATGEVSGQLDATLRRLHNHYEEQGARKYQNLTAWTPKLLFLLVALAIGYQVITFYMGYFNQLNQLGL